jgi:hypothetical protein
MGKKNLDKLFQERLKDFSEIPDDKVWQSIEASLDQKKKSRKVIPLWWKIGGVAAILLIAVSIINPFKDNSLTIPSVTDVNVDTNTTSEDSKDSHLFENEISDNEKIVDAPQETNSIEENEEDVANEQIATSNVVSEETKAAISQKSSKQKEFVNQNASQVEIAATNMREVQKTNETSSKISENNFESIESETEIAQSGSSKSEIEKNLFESKKDIGLPNDVVSPADKVVVENSNKDVTEELKKKSIFEEIAKQEEDEEVIADNSENKWSAGPSIAPVYYSAMGEGSPVHSIFVPNSKSGDVNLSYGLTVAYELNEKLSIRSGIHKVDYGYRTNEVEFSSSLESARSGQIDNIDYKVTAQNLVVNSKALTSISDPIPNNSSQNTSTDVSAVTTARDGIMEQQFGYLEVPVELNYAILDKRFGINIIGGVSSLFLVDNSISLSSGELTTDVGEANNINSVNFSTNVGFGLNYKVTPKVRLNIEPVFKYQLNTFSQTDGVFNPFSMGVYSGLSFKF